MASALGIFSGIASNPLINPIGYLAKGAYSGNWNPFSEEWMSGTNAAGSPGANLQAVGSIFGQSSEDMLSYSNDFNAEQAQIQRDWQERMSNTAYQRAVADLKAAGLNPWMLANGGQIASTPSGAMATSDTSAYSANMSYKSKIFSALIGLVSNMLKIGSSAITSAGQSASK